MGRGPVAFPGCLGQCASTHILYAMDCPREIRAVRRALLLPFEERANVLRKLVRFGPSIPVEAVKLCALVRLHMMAEEDSWRGSGDAIALSLQDLEVAAVASSCQKSIRTCCAKNCTKLKGGVVGLVFERACRLSDKLS